MDRLSKSMIRPGKNSSKKYEKLYESVKKAAGLKNSMGSMSPDQREEAVINANIAVIEAVNNYAHGKEKVRSSEVGNAKFANALDAAAIVTKYSPGMAVRTDDLIENINRIRSNGDPEAENDIDPKTFTEKNGAANAENAREKRLNPGGMTQDKGLQDLKTPTIEEHSCCRSIQPAQSKRRRRLNGVFLRVSAAAGFIL